MGVSNWKPWMMKVWNHWKNLNGRDQSGDVLEDADCRWSRQRERLNCLQISTHNKVIWNDAFHSFILTRSNVICAELFWAYYSTGCPWVSCMSTLIYTMQYSCASLPAVSVVASVTRVRLETSNSRGQSQVYDTVRGGGSGGRMLHIFMFTGDSKLLKDERY